MLRGALPLGIALLATLGSADAWASRTVTEVGGRVRALAFSGDALVAARQPEGKGLRFERLVGGAPANLLLATDLDDDEDALALAASSEALAIAVNPASGGGGRVLIGPSLGPLREVASCAAGLVVAPVAVAGARIAWREGGCGAPAPRPRNIGPSTVMIGGADAAAPVRRMPVPGDGLLVSLVLTPGDTGIAATLLPSFFGVDSDVREFAPKGVGATIATEPGSLLSPAGVLADGARVFMREPLDLDEEEERCETAAVSALAPAARERQTVPLGGCPLSSDFVGPLTGTGPVTAGDRIVALISEPPRRRGGAEAVAVVSVRRDGGDRRVLARGTYRRPVGIAADGARVAWWQPRCHGGSEIVVQGLLDAVRAAVASCRAEILTRRARVRDGAITLRVRCRIGCSGRMFAGRFALRPPSFQHGPGTHALRVPISLGRLRSARVPLTPAVDYGPARTTTITVLR